MTQRLHAARLCLCLLAAPLAWALRPADPRWGLRAAARPLDSKAEVQGADAAADGGKTAALLQLGYEHKSMDGAPLGDYQTYLVLHGQAAA